jgi:hypothetical protein
MILKEQPLGRLLHRCEDVSKVNVKEIKWEGCGLDSSGSGYGPLAVSCEHGNNTQVLLRAENFLTIE